MSIVFSKLDNGILFDLSARPNAGQTIEGTINIKKVFRPSTFHTITKVEVHDNGMRYTTIEDADYNFSYNGVGASKLIVGADDIANNYELFDRFILLL